MLMAKRRDKHDGCYSYCMCLTHAVVCSSKRQHVTVVEAYSLKVLSSLTSDSEARVEHILLRHVTDHVVIKMIAGGG